MTPSRRSKTIRLLAVALSVGLVACRLGFPQRVIEPSVVGIITENESVPGDDDQLVTVNGNQLRILDPGLRRIDGSSLGVDRLLIYWETDGGPRFVVSVKSTASDCYNLRSAAAYDTGDAIVFVWSEQSDLGLRLPKAPDYEPPLDDPESRALILPIEECLDADGVVVARE
jgi:hypothetical protein